MVLNVEEFHLNNENTNANSDQTYGKNINVKKKKHWHEEIAKNMRLYALTL